MFILKMRSNRKMKSGKTTGSDSIALEIFEALRYYGIDNIATLRNEIYVTGQIPPTISKSTFVALPEKPGATECEQV